MIVRFDVLLHPHCKSTSFIREYARSHLTFQLRKEQHGIE